MTIRRCTNTLIGLWLALLLAGCSGWRDAPVGAGTADAPRPGDQVEVVRRDGATRRGRLMSVDIDSVRCQDFAMAWDEVADIRPAAEDAPALHLGHWTRLTLRDGRKLEGYLTRTTLDSLFLETNREWYNIGENNILAAARSEVVRVEHKRSHPLKTAFGILVAAAIATALVLLYAFSQMEITG